MSINHLSLEFYGTPPELYRTTFANAFGEVYKSMRGKTHGAMYGAGSFQWSAAVKALSLLLVATARAAILGEPVDLVRMSGKSGSLARSLDYALSKQPEWVLDMFGEDREGRAYLKSLLRRGNPDMKMAGPVVIGVNLNSLICMILEIKVNGIKLTQADQLTALMEKLKESFGRA